MRTRKSISCPTARTDLVVWFRLACLVALTLSSSSCARQLASFSRAPILASDPVDIERRKELIDAFHRDRVRSIELDALGCYGSCPRYTARFSVDGRATLHDVRSECERTAVASIDFAHVVEAARIGGAEYLRPKYDFATVDVTAARITIRTRSKTYVSDGPDRTRWGPEFVTTFTRLDQMVRDINWRPRIALENCGAVARPRLVK